MNKILISLLCVFITVNVFAETFTGTHNIDSFTTDDNIINEGAVINSLTESPIVVTQSTTYITNNGQINGDIDINIIKHGIKLIDGNVHMNGKLV